jgi:hypothetical protein
LSARSVPAPSSPRQALDLELWRRALAPLILPCLNRRLHEPLGLWKQPPPPEWLALYSPATDRIYHHEGALWRHFRRTDLRVKRRLHHGTFCIIAGWCHGVPPDARRADVRRFGTHYTLLAVGSHASPVSMPNAGTLAQEVEGLPPEYSWTVATLLQHDNGLAVATAIRDSTCVNISDGSFKDLRSTSAFLLEGPTGVDGRIYGTNQVPGQRLDQDSCRCELGGILGALRTAECISKVHAIHSGHLRLGLDGSEAMKQAALVGPVHPLMRSYDLLAEIRALRSQLTFTVELFWVEGHQQERHGKDDYFGHLNDLFDNLAKAYWNQTCDSPSTEEIRVNYTTWGFGCTGAWPGQFNHTDFYDYTFGSKVSFPYW